MNASSIRRIENLRRLVAALADRPMGPDDVVGLLGVADRAARNYMNELKLAGVGRADPSQRGHLRLNADPSAVQDFLEELAAEGSACARHKPPGPRRDPLVSALFGLGASTPS